MNLQWYEVLSHFLQVPEDASITLELLDGEDCVVGQIGPLAARSLLRAGHSLEEQRRMHRLVAPVAESGGGFAAWLRPARQTTRAAMQAERFATVELRLTATLRYLAPGSHKGMPRTPPEMKCSTPKVGRQPPSPALVQHFARVGAQMVSYQ